MLVTIGNEVVFAITRATSHGRAPVCDSVAIERKVAMWLQCGCIGLMLFRYLSCLDAIQCDINTM